MTSRSDSVPFGHTIHDHCLIDKYYRNFTFFSNRLRTLSNSILGARSLPCLTTRRNPPLCWASIEWTGTVGTNMPNPYAVMIFHLILWMVLWVRLLSLGLGLCSGSTEIMPYSSTSASYAVSPTSLAVFSWGTHRLWSLLPRPKIIVTFEFVLSTNLVPNTSFAWK